MGLLPQEIAYNEKLTRYKNMVRWCDTHTHEEQLQYEPMIIEVTEACNDALNEVLKVRRIVTGEEIANGFYPSKDSLF